MDMEEKVIKHDPKYNGEIINVEQQTVKLANGENAHRDIVYHANAVAALMITNDNKMLIEKQWRAPVKGTTLEIPAGKLDSRDSDSPEHALNRELNEETRYHANHVEHLFGFYSSPGFTDEYLDLYLATDLVPVKVDLPRDKGEFLEIGEYTLPQALDLLHSGKIKDAKTIMAILYWQSMSK